MKTKNIIAIVMSSAILATNLCACGELHIEESKESTHTSFDDASTSVYEKTEGADQTTENFTEAPLPDPPETTAAIPAPPETTATSPTQPETAAPSIPATEPASSEEPTTSVSVPATEPAAPSETKPSVNPETEEEPSNVGGLAESGIYWLVGSVKNIFSNAGNYVGSFGKTVWTVVKGYINANPDTRFKAQLTDVMSVALEINSLETKLAKLDDKYDFTMVEMHNYAVDRQLVTADIVEAYSEKYSDDVLGWLQQQYSAFKNVGKRKIYLSSVNGEECLIMKEGKLSSPGTYDIYVATTVTREIEEDGFYKEVSVYYEISDALFSKVESDYVEYGEISAQLELKKSELEEVLNTISD